MWFLDQIVSWLASARDYFLNAYQTVNGWPFPFYYLSSPLWGIYVVFYYLTFLFSDFNAWADYAAGRIAQILSTWDIWSYFKWWFDAAQNAWNWVINAFYNVWQTVASWWSSAQLIVLAWVQGAKDWATSLFNQANAWLATLQSAWDSFKSKIPTIGEIISWWGNWWGNILGQLGTWWNNRLLDVQSLILSWFKQYEPFWAGWQEVRTGFSDFFSDPEKWLLDRLERMIARFL